MSTYVYKKSIPLWLVLAIVAPLGLVFLTSLLLAIAVIGVTGALAAFVLPLVWKRPAGPQSPNTIELDPSQYRRIGGPRGDRSK